MEKFNNVRIKDLIKKHPKIYEILDEYKIHCLKCKGNCYLKDVVEEENLTMDQEIDIMTRIGAVLESMGEEGKLEESTDKSPKSAGC